jgi:hypothetical protein
VTIPPGVRGAGFRIAWLLRVNRVLGPDRSLSIMSNFAAAFHGGGFSGGVSDSTVSRWETGAVRVPFAAVRRYEELLKLPPGQLVTVADTINRYAAPTLSTAPVLSRGEHPAAVETHVDALLERVLSNDPVSGWDWDELTAHLLGLPRFFLQSRTWTELSTRLLQETVVADGIAFLQRFEALTRLLSHPASQRHMVDACVRLVQDEDNQAFVEATSVLDATSHPDAASFLVRQLANPVNERVRYGALLGSVRKVRYGHFNDEQLDGLARSALDVMRDPAPDMAAGPLAAELLRQLPDGRVAAELRRTTDRMLLETHGTVRLLNQPTSDVMIERIVSGLAAGVGNDAVFTDEIVPVLVDELLFAPVLDVRFNAGILLWASPYAKPMSTAVGNELTRPAALQDPRLALCLLGALRIVGAAAQRPLVERLALASGLPPQVSLAAVRTLGHVGGVSSDEFWLRALERYGDWWRRHNDAVSEEALESLVYGLGIARNHALLRRVRDDRTAPLPVRVAGAWWLGRPERLFDDRAAAAH